VFAGTGMGGIPDKPGFSRSAPVVSKGVIPDRFIFDRVVPGRFDFGCLSFNRVIPVVPGNIAGRRFDGGSLFLHSRRSFNRGKLRRLFFYNLRRSLNRGGSRMGGHHHLWLRLLDRSKPLGLLF
jgi:hypothetical protein